MTILSGTMIEVGRLPPGWTATAEQLKPGKWEVRVYDLLGEVCFLDSIQPNRKVALAVAHREAWANYVERLNGQ